MEIATFFIVVAAVCWFLGAARVPAPVNWLEAGLCALTIGVFLV
jgi:hypothetical protein